MWKKSSTFARCKNFMSFNKDKMVNEHWQWQEPGEAWKGVGIYHVTLTVPSREPLLGKLIIPEDDPKKARVERTELGDALVNEIYHISDFHPQVRILQFCLMPDHLHIIVHNRQASVSSIRSIIRGFWQGAKKLGRNYTLSIDPEFNSGTTNKVNKQNSADTINPIFTDRPFIRPLSRQGQLDTMFHYIRLNPQRLATKRLKPGLFRVQDGIEIAGRTYKGVGNAELLQRAQYMPIHVRRTMVEAAEHGDDKPLRDYMNSCVIAARKGTVMVSPFISEYEQAVMAVLLKENLPFIYIADNGFHDYYKPQDNIFDAVARKQVMILSPWDYDPTKRHVSRADCVAMNRMAEEICKMTT